MSTFCYCALLIEDAGVAPRGTPIGKTTSVGCPNVILGIAAQLLHVSQVHSADGGGASPLSTFVCRITEAEEIVTVTDNKSVEFLRCIDSHAALVGKGSAGLPLIE
jgi:hypothetical protein